jgi:hypothetical protein
MTTVTYVIVASPQGGGGLVRYLLREEIAGIERPIPAIGAKHAALK